MAKMAPLPAWPSPTSEAGRWFFANAEAFAEEWRKVGVSRRVMLAFLARAELESSLRIPAPVGDDGTAFGPWQWHEDRVEAIKKGCGFDVRDPGTSIAQFVEAAWWELQNKPYLGWTQISAAPDVRSCAEAVCRLFSRAGATDAAERTGTAALRWDKSGVV